MKTPDFFREKTNEQEKKLIEETKIKLEDFFNKHVVDETGGDGPWCPGREIQVIVAQTVENELRKNGWKSIFWCNEDSDWSMTTKSERITHEMWLKIQPLTKEESILIR